MLITICSNMNDDKMVKNPLKISMERIESRWSGESVAEGRWWKFKDLGLSGLSSMWYTNLHNLSHLWSTIFKVLLLFLRKATEHSSGIRKIFLPLKNLSDDSTQLYVQELHLCVITSLIVLLISDQVFHQENSGSVWSSSKIICLIFLKYIYHNELLAVSATAS